MNFFVNTLCALLLNLRSYLSTVFSLLIILCNLQILFLIRLPIASTHCFPVSMIMIYKVAIHLGPYFILVVYWLYSLMYWILFHHPSQGLHKYFLIWCLLWGCLYLCSIVLLSLQSLGFCSHTNTHTWLSWSNLVSINLNWVFHFHLHFIYFYCQKYLQKLLLSDSLAPTVEEFFSYQFDVFVFSYKYWIAHQIKEVLLKISPSFCCEFCVHICLLFQSHFLV